MARKVFISFLGKGNYVDCRYSFDDGHISYPVCFVQEALIEHICRDWSEKDMIYIFYTSKETTGVEGSMEKNWVDVAINSEKTEIKVGLKHRLDDLVNNGTLKANIKDYSIPAGFSEQDIWGIFNSVYDKLDSSDQIYFDVTHAFRSIPMFSLVLFNHSKFMKDTRLNAIFYGAFDTLIERYGNLKEMLEKCTIEKRIAPIIDLTNIALLQEYNQIASEMKYFGKVKSLSNAISVTNAGPLEKTMQSLSRSISKLYEYITTIDLQRIKKGAYITEFSNSYKHLKNKNVLPLPIKNILDGLSNLISEFENKDSFKNIEAAINWTIKYEMLMQTYPLAAEYIIMRVADNFKSYKPKELRSKEYREFIGNILGTPDEDFVKKQWKDKVALYPEIANLIAEESLIIDIRPYYDKIRRYRNSLAHGNGSVDYSELKNNVAIIKDCIDIIKGHPLVKDKAIRSIFLNLSNHPSTNWSEEQLTAAREYGEIKDIPFPYIEENLDEEGIDLLTDDYLEKIRELSGGEPCTIHIMGEMTFTHTLVNKLKAEGYTCVASTSWRDVEIMPDGSKQVKFHFCRFRKY